MRILLTGASGFLGRHLAKALSQAGHEVVCALRRPRRSRSLPCRHVVTVDMSKDLAGSVWLPHLEGIDAVVNAVGILRERRGQRFDVLHGTAPRALFAACVQAQVGKVMQISALGADEQAVSRYHLSKKATDDFLLGLPLRSEIVQPSLIYGPGGTSARLFNQLASLPLIPLPGDGEQRVQPIHIDDAVRAIVALLERDAFDGQRVALVGPQPLPLRQFLAELREAMGFDPPRFVSVPLPLVRATARIGSHLPGSLLDAETLAMLERGNTGDVAQTRALLGRPPRAIRDFVTPPQQSGARALAQLAWLLPLLRGSLALMWIVTGLLSLGLYPVPQSYALLTRVGAAGIWLPLLLYGAALLDLTLGLGILVLARRRPLWWAQMALIIGYTAVISWRLPEFWRHPFGPILKNLPILAALLLLAILDDEH